MMNTQLISVHAVDKIPETVETVKKQQIKLSTALKDGVNENLINTGALARCDKKILIK